VVILRSGEIVASGTVSEVLQKTRHNNVQIRIPAEFVEQAKDTLRTIPDALRISQKGTSESLYWLDVELKDMPVEEREARARVRHRLLSALVEAEIPILNYDAAGVSLQDIFLQLTTEEQ
jgi:ABC-type multidrug transport system ATPase subunit